MQKNFSTKTTKKCWPNFICIFYSMHIILHKNFTCLKKLLLESLQTRRNYYCCTYILSSQVHGYSLLYPPNPSSLPCFTGGGGGGGVRHTEPGVQGLLGCPWVSWREQCAQGDQVFCLSHHNNAHRLLFYHYQAHWLPRGGFQPFFTINVSVFPIFEAVDDWQTVMATKILVSLGQYLMLTV